MPGRSSHSGQQVKAGGGFPLWTPRLGEQAGWHGEHVPQSSPAFPISCNPPSSPRTGAHAGPHREPVGDKVWGHRFLWNGSVASAGKPVLSLPRPSPPPSLLPGFLKLLLSAFPPRPTPSAQPGAQGHQRLHRRP